MRFRTSRVVSGTDRLLSCALIEQRPKEGDASKQDYLLEGIRIVHGLFKRPTLGILSLVLRQVVYEPRKEVSSLIEVS